MAEENKDTGVRETDGGMVIGPDQVAVVVGPDGRQQILIPQVRNMEISEQATALLAAAMRLANDPEFYKEMVEWFDRFRGQLGKEEPD